MVAKYDLVLERTSTVGKIHLIGPVKVYLAQKMSLQRSNCNILGLTDTVALLANESRFFRFRVFSGMFSPKRSLPPICFAFLEKLVHYLSAWQV